MTELTPQHMLHFHRGSAKIEDIGFFELHQIEGYVNSPDKGRFMIELNFNNTVSGHGSITCRICDTEEEAIAEKTRFADLYNKAIETLAASEAKRTLPSKQQNVTEEEDDE